MNERRWTLAELNAMDRDGFSRVVGPVFECSAWIAGIAWAQRPFPTLDSLHAALCAVVKEAGETRQIDLIQAHPDLVGRAAAAGTLTAASQHEQSSAGLDRLNSTDTAAFTKFNAEYRERFGFPFVICARLNKKEAILAAFPVRLQNNRSEEIQTALGEISKIARLRLEDLVRS
ncbi:MAG: 2-oxo-4-hydroxy-4-carboxy-5-ureidoimidazoline decarboxylase [Verrucomicrobiota bacterium]|jgi:OHCU decarboxylase